MSDPDEEFDDVPPLPERSVLDAWTVPPAAPDLTDRVLAQLEREQREGAMAMEATVLEMSSRRRGGLGLAVVGVAMVAAAGLVLGLVQLWRPALGDHEHPPAVANPVLVPVVVPIPAPSSPAPPAQVTAPPVAPSAEPVPGAAADAEAERHDRARKPDPSTGLKDPFGRDPGAGSEPDPSSRGSSPHPEGVLDPFDPKAKGKAKTDEAKKTVTLRIGTMPGYGWAKVYVDGEPVGQTPIVNHKVTPGRHTVKWVWLDGKTAKATLVLEAGETRVVKGPPSEDAGDPLGDR